MVTLIVGGYYIDLGEDIAADLTYSISDIRRPDQRQVNFSKTLNLPGSSSNNRAFGYIYDLHTENIFDENLPNVGINFNPKKLATAKLYKDGIQVFDGALRLWRARKIGEVITYEVSLYGKLFDLFGTIGDKKLSDLDFSDLDHSLTWANIQANWTATSPAYRYPLIDYGKLIIDLTGKPSEMKIGAIGPCIYHKTFLDRIFTAAGATYNLNFNQSIYEKILVTPNRGDVVGKPTYFAASDATAFRNYDAPSGGTGFRSFSSVQFSDTIDDNTVALMPGSNFTRLNFPSNLETSIQYKLKFQLSTINYPPGAGGTAELFIKLVRGGSTSTISQVNVPIPGSPAASTGPLTLTVEIPKQNFLSGDLIRIDANVPDGYRLTTLQGSTITLVSPNDASEYSLTDGDTYELNRSIPKDISQVDFIKDFIRLFNLYVTQNPANEKEYIFTPFIDFYLNDRANAKDWSYKIDRSQEVTITPVSQLTAKAYLFTWKADKDYFNTIYTDNNSEVYGQLNYIGDTDLVSNTEKIESIFSPAIMQRYTGSNCITPAIYKVDNGLKKGDSFNPRLIIWGGLKAAGHNILLKDSSGATLATITQYPYAGHIDDPLNPSFDLNFGSTKTDLPAAAITTFTRYWLPALLEALDKDSKLVEGKFLITTKDIEELDFASLIKVDNQFFRLNKIEGFNPFDVSTSKVELVKKL
jgi:hypothetical protein